MIIVTKSRSEGAIASYRQGPSDQVVASLRSVLNFATNPVSVSHIRTVSEDSNGTYTSQPC